MKSLIKKLQFLLLLFASIAASLCGSAGIARIPGWNPSARVGAKDFFSPDELSAIKARFAKFRVINEANPEIW